MVFKPNRFKLYCPAIHLNENIHYIEETKYLGYMFTNDKENDLEMLRQTRLRYMPSYKIICMFLFCTKDVKLELLGVCVHRFTATIYEQGTQKSISNRLCVAFNNAYLRIIDLT